MSVVSVRVEDKENEKLRNSRRCSIQLLSMKLPVVIVPEVWYATWIVIPCRDNII